MDDDREPTLPEPTQEMPPPPPAAATPPRGLSSQPAMPHVPAGAAGSRARIGAGMMLGGGIVVVLSLFLPRFTVTSAAGTASVSGLSTAVIWILVLSAFAIAHGLQGLRPGTVRFQLGSPVVTGVLMMVAMAFRWADISNGLDLAAANPGITASVGPGFWLALAGSVVVLCGALLTRFGDRAR